MKSNIEENVETVNLTVEGSAQEMVEQENQLTLQMKLTDALEEYFQNKEIISERTERAEILKDVIRDYHERLGGHEMLSELRDGTFGKVLNRTRVKEKLDVEALALRLKMSPSELKTPYDFTKLTQTGIISSEIVSEYLEDVQTTSLSVTKVKNKPKDKKKKKY